MNMEVIMRQFVTSDLHFADEGIIEYADRPFKSEDIMHETLIRNWNQRVKPEDIVYSVGDFCFRGGSKGGKHKAEYWESRLNGKLVHILGNHDENNGVRGLTSAVVTFAGRNIYMVHEPPKVPIGGYAFIISGHVHNLYKHKLIGSGFYNQYIINVGVDQWKFAPVKLDEVIIYFDKLEPRPSEILHTPCL